MNDSIASAPHKGGHSIFLSGPPGSGKTTLAVRRLEYLLNQGMPAEQILVLVPQRTLATPYYDALYRPDAPASGVVDVATIGGLARRTIDLFWPLIAAPAGFVHPTHRPLFLTLETSQYHMDRIAGEFLDQGAFDGITITRARLASQIIDNLNKAAAVGFSTDEIASRLKRAWRGEQAMNRIYDQVQALALAFRADCLAENRLDWSLQIEVFQKHLLPLPQLRRYMLGGYRHLIVDNTEEDIPAAHDLLRTWLPLCESALVVYDTGGGYRVFLGADPKGALDLSKLCTQQIALTQSHITTPHIEALGKTLARRFYSELVEPPQEHVDPLKAVRYETHHFHPEMIDHVADEISRLVHEQGRPPGEIAVLAPFLSDALRFSLTERLHQYNIHVRTHRPSRPLREDPAARCLLTLAQIAHPHWRRPPQPSDVAQALDQAISGMDPVRAKLLTNIVYRVRDNQPVLTPFHGIKSEIQERITYLLGTRYGELWNWIQAYVEAAAAAKAPGSPTENERLDHFLSKLFGEVLSQPGFGFHHDMDAGQATARLIESIQKFHQALGGDHLNAEPETRSASGEPPAVPEQRGRADVGLAYVDMVERGVVAAQYISSWQLRPQDAVLLVPAYTFLMMNQPVDIQFWLDAGSSAWSERIYQPLTHPFVLQRDWDADRVWTDEDELRVKDQALGRLVLGLTRRCRQHIYLAFTELNERGNEQQGPLRHALQALLRAQTGVGS